MHRIPKPCRRTPTRPREGHGGTRHAAGGLALALALALAACSGSGGSTAAPASSPAAPPASAAEPSAAATAAVASPSAPAAGTAVTIANFAFGPAEVTVAAGSSVTWTNQDTAAHTVTFEEGGPESSRQLGQGGTFRATFDQAGTFPYMCSIHPSMKGTVVVTG